MRNVRIHLADPDFRSAECLLKLTLSYEGPLRTSPKNRARHKHAIRREFHRQLKRFWDVHPLVSRWHVGDMPASDWLQNQMPRIGQYSFVPLVSKALNVECALEFRVLRPTGKPGTITDIDNQVKVLIDAMKIPTDVQDLGGGTSPEEGEEPMYVLLQDDGLVTKISSINDELLRPILGKSEILSSDVVLIVDIHIRPLLPTDANIIFFSSDSVPWDHKLPKLPEDLRRISSNELRALTTQTIMRLVALNESDSRQSRPHVKVSAEELSRIRTETISLWRSEYWMQSRALHAEMLHRIYGEGPYPEIPVNPSGIALEMGVITGVNPLGQVAAEMERLARLIP